MTTGTISIEALGLTQKELADRIISTAVDRLLAEENFDDGEFGEGETKFARAMKKHIIKRIDQAVDEIAMKNVIPNVGTYLENLLMTPTNQWGERKGNPVTFTEYLITRVDAYMTEDVSYDGKSKREANGFSWSKSTTRVSFMVHQHLDHHITHAMKNALANVNSKIVGGLEAAVKDALEKAMAALKVSVTTK